MNQIKNNILQKLCSEIGATIFSDTAQLELNLSRENLTELFGEEVLILEPLCWDDCILPDYQSERVSELNNAFLNIGEWRGTYDVFLDKIGIASVTEYRKFFINNLGSHCMEGYIVKNESIQRNDDSINQLLISVQKALNKTAIVSITDKKGIIIYANNLFSEISGFDLDELIGKSHSVINSGYHQSTFFVGLWKTITAGNVWRGEVCNRKKTGDLYWVDTAISPIFNSEGEIDRYLSVRFDITNRKNAEILLEKSEQFSKSILSTMSSNIAVVDSNGVILFANESWEKESENFGVGISSRPPVGANYFEILEESNNEANCSDVLKGLCKLIEGSKTQLEMEYQCDKGDNTRWCIFSASVINDSLNRILIRHVDITNRKRIEFDLAKSKTKYLDLIDNIQEGICTDDLDGKITFANKRFLDFFNLTWADLNKKYIFDIADETEKNRIISNHNKRINGEKIVDEIEFKGKSVKGESRWFKSQSKLLFRDGEIVGTQSIVSDITERKKLFREIELKESELNRKIEELQQKNEELIQFNYIISHNLRSPLTNVVGLSEILPTRINEPTKAMEIATYIRDSAVQLDDVVKDLSSILSLTVDDQSKIEEIDLVDLIHTISKSLMIIDNIRIDIKDEYRTVNSINHYLESILHNILSNSAKYRSKLRPLIITVLVEMSDDEWILEVEDNGLGLDTNKHRHELFGMYKRFHPTAAEGKGIGLYITKKQVDLLKGYIEYQGAPERGTKVALRFKK